ncbi:MAG: hypothetical protein ACO1QB_14910 [Verrucomicrobiales bacterium]
MQTDNLERFLELQTALNEEKEEILNRLQEIDRALGSAQQGMEFEIISHPVRTKQGKSSIGKPGAVTSKAKAGKESRRKVSRNSKSLREAVLEVLATGRKTKQEVLEAVLKSGYQFTTSNPMNSLGVILYGSNPRFAKNNGKFGVA